MHGGGARGRHRRAPICQLGGVTQSYTCVHTTLGVLATSTGLMLSLDATGVLDDAAAEIREASRR